MQSNIYVDRKVYINVKNLFFWKWFENDVESRIAQNARFIGGKWIENFMNLQICEINGRLPTIYIEKKYYPFDTLFYRNIFQLID